MCERHGDGKCGRGDPLAAGRFRARFHNIRTSVISLGALDLQRATDPFLFESLTHNTLGSVTITHFCLKYANYGFVVLLCW